MGDTQTDAGHDDIRSMSVDRLRALRPDLLISDPAPILEAREALEQAVETAEVGEATRAALKTVIRESDDPVAALINTAVARIRKLDLGDGDREAVLSVVSDVGAKLGIDIGAVLDAPADEAEGVEEEVKADDGEEAVDQEPAPDVAGQIEARDALDDALEDEDLQATEAVRREVRTDVRRQIASGLRGTEAVTKAVADAVARYHRVIESVSRGKAQRIQVPDSGDERATESPRKVVNGEALFHPLPSPEED